MPFSHSTFIPSKLSHLCLFSLVTAQERTVCSFKDIRSDESLEPCLERIQPSDDHAHIEKGFDALGFMIATTTVDIVFQLTYERERPSHARFEKQIIRNNTNQKNRKNEECKWNRIIEISCCWDQPLSRGLTLIKIDDCFRIWVIGPQCFLQSIKENTAEFLHIMLSKAVLSRPTKRTSKASCLIEAKERERRKTRNKMNRMQHVGTEIWRDRERFVSGYELVRRKLALWFQFLSLCGWFLPTLFC